MNLHWRERRRGIERYHLSLCRNGARCEKRLSGELSRLAPLLRLFLHHWLFYESVDLYGLRSLNRYMSIFDVTTVYALFNNASKQKLYTENVHS